MNFYGFKKQSYPKAYLRRIWVSCANKEFYSNVYPGFPERSSFQEYQIPGRSLISTHLILRRIRHEEPVFFDYPACRVDFFLFQATSKHSPFHWFSFFKISPDKLVPRGNLVNKVKINDSQFLESDILSVRCGSLRLADNFEKFANSIVPHQFYFILLFIFVFCLNVYVESNNDRRDVFL